MSKAGMDILVAIAVGLVAVADFWLIWNFPSSIWPWAVLLFLVVSGVAYWYRPSNFYRRCIGLCLSILAALAVAPSFYVSLSQGVDKVNLEMGGSTAMFSIAFFGLTIVFIILDCLHQIEGDRGVVACWIISGTTICLGFSIAIASWGAGNQDPQTLTLDNGSIGEVNTNNNSPINTQGNITYNQSGVKSEHIDKLVQTMEENSQLKSEVIAKDQLIAKLKQGIARAANEPGDVWREALKIAEETGDAANLQALLTSRANELKAQTDEKSAEFVEVSLEASAVAVARGDFEEGRHHLRNVLEVQPNSVSALLSMGNSYVFQGELEPSLNYYQQAIDLSKDDKRFQAYVLHNMATVCILSERHAEGFEFATKMLSIAEEIGDPKMIADAKSDLGACLIGKGNLTLAESLLTEAYQFHHKRDDRGVMVNDLNSLGLLYMRQQRFDKAKQMFELSTDAAKKIGRERAATISQLNSGIIYMRFGDHASAIDQFDRIKESIELSGNKLDLALWCFSASEAHYMLGNAGSGLDFEKRGTQIAESVKHYEMALGFHEQLGKEFLKQNLNNKAIERLKKALEVAQGYGISESRTCVIVRNNLGLGYRRNETPELALNEFKQVMSIAEKHKYLDLQALALNNIGLIALDNEDLDQAESSFTKSLSIMGENDPGFAATLNRNLGGVALMKGDIKQAKSSWTRAVELFRSVDNEPAATELKADLQSLDSVQVPKLSPLK